MITFKAIVIPGGRRRDGTHPVKIRVTFRGVSRLLPTTLVCTDSDLTRAGKIRSAQVLDRSGELIARMRAACADLSPFTLESWDVDRAGTISSRPRHVYFKKRGGGVPGALALSCGFRLVSVSGTRPLPLCS